MNWQRDIEILTPCFCRGAYRDQPEIRVPSIRGMVRWWFRALGGTPDEEKAVFGGMKRFGDKLKDEVVASHLVFRVSNVVARRASPDPATLPHKSGGQASPQAAFQAGARFHLEVFSRYGSLDSQLQHKVENALEVWTFLGSLGLRANRGGGSIWPADGSAPKTPAELRQRLNKLSCPWPVYLADTKVGNTVEALRAAATDTLNALPYIFGQTGLRKKDLEEIHKQDSHLLTPPFTDHERRRLASPLKIKLVRLDNQLRLLITAPREDIITRARAALKGHRSKPDTWKKI